MSAGTKQRNHLAAALAKLPLIGHIGRLLAEERLTELAWLGACLLMAVILAILLGGGTALIILADALTALAFLIVLALTFE